MIGIALTNNAHLFFQAISVVAWFHTISLLESKRKYIPKDVFWILLISALSVASSLIWEVVKNDFNLEWNLW